MTKARHARKISLKNFFDPLEDDIERFHPRSIFIDLEPEAIDSVKTGKFRNFYDERYLIGGKETSSVLFSNAMSLARKMSMIDEYMDKIHDLAEKCESL